MIAALYARVSTARQEEQETIDSQIEEIKKRIQEDGNILPSENVFTDDGWTGEMLQRPGLDTMRDGAVAGAFQVLYVYDRGRLSRVFAYQEIIIEELVNLDIQFVTLHDINAETPEERVLQAMQGVFHEYERVKIVERMRRGKLFKARNGILINGHSIYGYDYIKKTDTEPAHYKINNVQSGVVKQIFDWVGNEGISLNEVIRKLYDIGIPPRKGKSEFWTKGPVVRLLQCESYLEGYVYFNKSESCVAKKPIKNIKYKKIKRSSRKMRPREDWIPFKIPAILNDRPLFERVQKILDINQRFAPKNRKHDYLLTSLVFCGCGNRRAGDGQNKHGHFYYRCTERIYNFPSLERKCQIPGINAVILDGMVWRELMKFVKDPETLRKKVEEVLKERKEKTADRQENERLASFINKIEEEEQRYAKAYGADTLEFEQFRDLMRDANKRKQGFQTKLSSLKINSDEEDLDKIQVDDICYEAQKVLDGVDYSDKFKSVRTLLDKVIIKEGGWVEVCGHIPLFALKLGDEPTSRNCGIA
ncbi:MAG: recombinase family protein [Candidatus Daviesbacteria bacterium]